jgi:hypothetical protein
MTSPYRNNSIERSATAEDFESVARRYLAGFETKEEETYYQRSQWQLSGSTTDSVLGAVFFFTLANRFRLEGIEQRLERIESTLGRIEETLNKRGT